MENVNKLKSNTNLLQNIYSYLNIKDLSQINSINKHHLKLSKNFNSRWKSACYKYFSSEYDNYK